jgi:hypothetical protein
MAQPAPARRPHRPRREQPLWLGHRAPQQDEPPARPRRRTPGMLAGVLVLAGVFATFPLAAEDVTAFDIDATGATCARLLEDHHARSLADLRADNLEVRPLVGSAAPAAGDTVVCFVRDSDGNRRTGSFTK